MACPACSGTERDPIAPGYWRCTSPRTVVDEVGGPGLTNPAAGPGVIQWERVVPCGTLYQETTGETLVQCRCGTFAVGLCVVCDDPVCGSHSDLHDDRRLCSTHLGEARRAAAVQRDEAQKAVVSESIERRIAVWNEWLAAAREALSESRDEGERVVRVVAALAPTARRPSERGTEPDVVPRLLVPEAVRGSLGTRWWWDHDAVQRWFVGAATTPPEPVGIVQVKQTFSGRIKRSTTGGLGWRFAGGSTHASGERGTPTFFPSAATILTDGRRLLGADPVAGGAHGLNERALAEMAALIDVAPLPPLPPMSYNHPKTGEPIWAPAIDVLQKATRVDD